jgi:hypothetical protein
MNPKLISVASTGAKKVLGNKYIVIGIIVLIILFFLKGRIKKMIKNYNEKQFDKNETTDVNQLAQQYRSASNPSGSSWMIDFDGTDEDAIEKLAFQTKGHFTNVASAYKQKFDETLTDRVRAELDSDEFKNWHNIIT